MPRTSKQRNSLLSAVARNEFEIFFRRAPFGFSMVDCNLRYTYVNEFLAAANRMSAEQMVGRVIDEVQPEIHIEDRSAYLQVIATGEPMMDVELADRVPNEAGGVRYWNCFYYPIKSDDGVILAVARSFRNKTRQKLNEMALEKAFLEINELKDRLEVENDYLRDEIEVMHKHEEIIGQSGIIRKVLSQVELVAHTNSTVLITGETGTGKELLARAIHGLSPRKGRAMVKVNCAALPAALIESELFGREKGAYTGASTRQIGRFEAAHGSTIFLDEIGELPLELQAKLLRVIQEGQFERLGSNQTITVDVRVIAATNRDLAQAVKAGKFREDLFYRLNVFPIAAPPLRDRREDIPLLVWAVVREMAGAMGKAVESISKSSMDACQRYGWPGNVRELRNVVERAMIMSRGPVLHLDLPNAGLPVPQVKTLDELERAHIVAVLERTGWRVRGKGCAAEILGLKPTTLDYRLRKLGIVPSQERERQLQAVLRAVNVDGDEYCGARERA